MNARMSRNRLARVSSVALVAAGLILAACDVDEFLEVQDPDTVNPGTLEDPAVLDVVIAGAIGDFVAAYSGDGGDAFLSVSAVMTDEFFSSGTFPTRTATDRRDQFGAAEGNTSDAAYIDLHQARRALKDAAAKVVEFRDASDPAFAELKALEGFTYLALGEGWCSAIPISGTDESGAFVFGQPQSVADIFSAAVTIFDESLGGGPTNAAAVGKARALMNLGQYSAAAAAVAGVPTDFVYFTHHSDPGAANPFFSLQGNGRYSVSDNEGTNGLAYRSANDPRVPWIRDPDQPDGFDAAYPLYKSLRYTDFDSPVALASGVEARLIDAEAALDAGDVTGWLDGLNALRANVGALMTGLVPSYAVENPSLDPLADPGTDTGRRDIMFSERALWMWGTGHRLGDMRRLVTQYSMSQDAVFPTGAYHKGGGYGVDVAFPVDFDETNNTNYRLEDCDVTRAN